MLEGLIGLVITYPDLEQITEHEHRIGIRVTQVPREGVEGPGQGGAQVQIGHEVQGLPGRGQGPSVQWGDGVDHGHVSAARAGAHSPTLNVRPGEPGLDQATSTARSMVTPSSGTS